MQLGVHDESVPAGSVVPIPGRSVAWSEVVFVLALLSYGQLSVLRSIEHIDVSQWHIANIAYWLPLRTGLATDEVHAALNHLARRHESLRTVYRLPEEGPPTQRVEKEPISVVEYAEIDNSAEAQVALVEASRQCAFRIEDEVGWRATIATTDGTPRGIGFCIHHIAADGWAQRIVGQGLSPILKVAPHGPSIDGRDAVRSPGALASEQRSTSWRERRQRGRRYLRDFLASGLLTPSPFMPGERLRTLPTRHDGELRLDHLAGALLSRARGMRLLPHTLLLAAATLTTAACFDELSAAWWLMSSNRFDPRTSGLVTSMNQVVPVHADLIPRGTVAELIQRLQANSLASLRYASYDVDEFNNLAEEMIGGRPRRQYMFNYALNEGFTGTDDKRPLDQIPFAEPRVTSQQKTSAASCYFIVVDEPCLTLEYQTTLPQADERHVAALLRTYETILRHVLLQPESSVRRLLDQAVPGIDSADASPHGVGSGASRS
ncbi:condensation domain-containing protein [Micromonospora sp. NPDC053740]|uniref:condensation domain-containing protein n=1 Tax=Micromonospora sp. NPDC053740 TaxID=3155173 RepID=UPI00343F52EE